MPKGFRKKMKLTPQKVGVEQRQSILDDIDNKGTFLPRGVYYEDMDEGLVDFVSDDLKVVIDGEEVPVIFLTIQRWSEFSKTWQHADKYKNIQMPFITIVRQPAAQVGTNQAGLFNIPGRRTYTYMKVPTWDGNRSGVDVYKIPQPTPVDITYEVRLFCNRMRDLNKLQLIIQQEFQSKQRYIRVNGHPMPLTLETIGDESNVDDLDNRRFYVQLFEIKMAGYILDEDQFEVVSAINRALVVAEISDTPLKPRFKVKADKDSGTSTYSVVFKPKTETNFTTIAEYDTLFTTLSNISNISNIIIRVNGVEKVNGLSVTESFEVSGGDSIYIEITKEFLATGKFQLTGNIL
jgi:hypothetical protein